jgi:hypothetical protein
MKSHNSICVGRMWCKILTDPVLRCFVNPKGLSCGDLLVGVVPRDMANGLRLSTVVPSQDLTRAWVTVQGESQPGQVPLHRIRQGLRPPPPMNSGPGDFTHLSRVILVENLDGSIPAHTKGREGNLSVRTQIRSLRMLGRWGTRCANVTPAFCTIKSSTS